MNPNNRAEDEIDFRNIFSIIFSSKIFILITTIFFILISLAFSNFFDKDYALNIEIHLAKTQSPGLECRKDLSFNVFHCQKKLSRSIDLYDEFMVQDVLKKINRKIEDSGLKYEQLSNLNPLRYAFYSPNNDQLDSLTNQIYELISLYDDKLIELWLVNYEEKISALEAFLKTEKLLEAKVGKEKAIEKKLLEDTVGKGQAIEEYINELRTLGQKGKFIKSYFEPKNPKTILEDNKIKNALFAMFFGLFVSISISLFRYKDVNS